MQVMTEIKTLPKLRFGEYTEIINKIKFSEVVKSNIYGPRFNANDYDKFGNVKTIRGTDVSIDGEIKYSQVPIARIDEKTVNLHKLSDGDLIMITTADCGLTGVFRKQKIEYIASAYAVKISLKEKTSPFYFKYFFQTDVAKRAIRGMIRKATVANLPASDIIKIKLHLPSLPEQQKIASFLSAVDKKLQQLTKKKKLLEEYKKGVMQKIFSQELRLKDEFGNNYPDWEEKRLVDFENLEHGDGDWILSKDISKNGNYKIIQLGNIGFGEYINKKLKTISKEKFIELNGTPINRGDLLINRMVDNNINACIFDKEGEFITSVDVCWIRLNNYFNNYFLMSLIILNNNQNKLLSLSSGSGRVRISKKNLFEKFSFKLPSLKEQQKIANFLSSLDSKIDLVSTQIENTKAFKKGLLQQMFV
jgi:type I restriction enzyme, S subunit